MYFKNVIYFCDGKAEFSAVISPAFSLVIVTVLSLLLHFFFFLWNSLMDRKFKGMAFI